MSNQKIYFPNLNGLRFLAAFLVIIHHIEQIKSTFKIDNYWTNPSILIIGKLGVILFFVLSGFLITYLILAEERLVGEINIKKFYLRRILRIWPLYFLVILLAFFVLPYIDFLVIPKFGKEVIYSDLLVKLSLFAIIFPNLVLSVFGVVPYASHTWSIGTEEQFYCIWPIIFRYVKNFRLLLLLCIIFSYLLFGLFLLSHYSDAIPYKHIIRAFFSTFNIDCMAIGGIYALLLFQKSVYLKFLLNTKLFYLTVILVLIMMFKGFYLQYINFEFYSVLFGIIILNFAANDNIKITLENKILNYLGSISYGLYMYHPIGIVVAIAISMALNLTTNWIIYPLSFVFTILMAGLSHKYFESYFLRFKIKFSNIISGIGI